MKRKAVSILSLALFLASLLSLAAPCSAAQTRSSDYFFATDVWITAQEGGKILVEFDVNATCPMLEVGVKTFYIYEQQSSGNYKLVKTFSRYDTPGLINTNSFFADGEVTYQGTPGVKYYATAAFYAKDSAGSETLCFDTKVVTARN